MKKMMALVSISVFCFLSCDAIDNAKAQAAELEKAGKKLAAEAEKLNIKAPNSNVKPQNLEEAMKGLEGAMGELGKGLGTFGGTAINFRDLKKELPKSVGGLRRTKASGTSAGQMGLKFSTAEAKYSDGKSTIDLKLIDMAATKGLLAMASWANIEVEEESDDGYKKTYDYKGGRMMEEWRSKSKRASLNYMLNSRFIVEVKGRGADMKLLKKAVDDIDFDRLTALGVKADKAAAAKAKAEAKK